MEGVRDGPKEETVRQAIRDFGSKGGSSGEMTVQKLSEEPSIKDPVLRRWACENEETGDGAFPGNGSPEINKDYEIVKLEKKIEEFEPENELLKNFRALSGRDHVRGPGSPRRMGTGPVPSRRHASRWEFRDPAMANISQTQVERSDRMWGVGGIREGCFRAVSRKMRSPARYPGASRDGYLRQRKAHAAHHATARACCRRRHEKA